MKRLYVSEHKRFLQEKSFEIAQAFQRFNNTWNWYQSRPLRAHLDSMLQQYTRIGELLKEVEESHQDEVEDEQSHIADPEREE